MSVGALRGGVRRFVDHSGFQNTVIVMIVLNGLVLGLQTYEGHTATHGSAFLAAEHIFVGFFVVELLLKFSARGWAFFRDPWNWFDLIVVGVSLIPTTSGFSVVRTLRLLRLISVIPQMRTIVNALFRAVPGLGTVIALLFVIIYTSAVMGANLFKDIAPEFFDNVGISLYTVFRLLTTEDWPEVSDAVIDQAPLAWIYFVVVIVVSAFVVLNLIIGVIVTSLQGEVDKGRWEEDQEIEQRLHDQLMAKIEALSDQVAVLDERVRELGGRPDPDADREIAR
ncbi:voltage-gated sodium channel [Nocardiopsis mwathae]|uniref:Voltage-gated sodium channel n=1 Tax=Nocardiopsis mwathae TaxID=1472723 RepID=A0A7W9YJY0_9ACTN|nr:ion transporter [Nocardiopsis mwathae]MBB6173533.1 voltage-gated sodium channel [Nocardiopsis mwathae]